MEVQHKRISEGISDVWGQRHLCYLKQHRKVFYTNLLTSGKLNSYLADIDTQAEDMFLRLVEQIAEVFLFGQYWCMGIQHFVYFLTVFFKYKAVFLAIHIFFKVGKIGKQLPVFSFCGAAEINARMALILFSKSSRFCLDIFVLILFLPIKSICCWQQTNTR